MLDWLQRLLHLAPQQQLVEIEHRELSLEERLERILSRLGDYSRRSPTDLEELIRDLTIVIDIVDKIVATLENIGGVERAKLLRQRLRYSRTRAKNQLEKLKEAS